MRRGRRSSAIAGAAVLAAALVTSSAARAALTSSETAQIRGYVAAATHADRVRALVARPDLSEDESAAAMTAAIGGITLDMPHLLYLDGIVHGAPSPAARPVLAEAVVRGVLARIEALYAAHPADLERNVPALDEIRRGYDLAAIQISGPDPAITDSTRADLGRALIDHVGREAPLLRLDQPVGPNVAGLRAQLSLSILESLPDGPTRKVDAADKLHLTGARRATLIQTGVLVLDRGGDDDRLAQVRAVIDRLPQIRGEVEALWVTATTGPMRARGAVVTADDVVGPLGEAGSPWGPEADPPQVSALTVSVARALAHAVVSKATNARPVLGVQVKVDGPPQAPEKDVERVLGMLVVDPARTLDVASSRFLAGDPKTAAWLGDAMGALAVGAPPSEANAKEGLVFPLGTATVTHVTLAPTGNATAFKLDGHLWRIDRDEHASVTSLKRDGVPVTLSMLPAARVAVTAGNAWNGAGLVFARLAGSPKVAISAGPKIRVVGSSVADAVSTPAPGDDVTIDADLHVDGGAAGVVVRALPGNTGIRGVSLLLVPGAPPHAVLVAGDGSGNDIALGPAVEVRPASVEHVKLVVKGKQLTVTVGPAGNGASATLTSALPDDLLHGDVALRAYPGVTLEVSRWHMTGSTKVAGKK